MPTMYIYIIAVFVLVYVVFFIVMKAKRGQQKDIYNNLDMRQEAVNATAYQTEYLNGMYSFIQSQLEQAPVEAFTASHSEQTLSSGAKDVASNLLKGAATLGTVRFTTVHTPKYLALSNGDLHLLDTDKEGEISAHLVFDRNRLQQASLTETTKANAPTFGKYPFRSYRLELPTDNKPITLIIHNIISDIMSTPSYSIKEQVKEFVVGNYFLNKLGEQYSNLKVTSDLPKA